MSERLAKLCSEVGAKTHPVRWDMYEKEIFFAYDRNPDFLPEGFVAELEKRYHCFDELLSVYEEAADQIRQSESLCTFLFFVIWSLKDPVHQKADVRQLPKSLAVLQQPYPMLYGIASLFLYDTIHDSLAKRGIPETLITNVLRLNTILVESYKRRHKGKVGYDLLDWARHYFNGEIFRVGRFEMEIGVRVGNHDTPYDSLRAVGLHIPPNEPFTPEVVEESFREIQRFLASYYPEFVYDGFHCESWLLSPALAEVLPPESNILAFQKRFDIFRTVGSGSDVYDFVFSLPNGPVPLDQLPEKTSLQRAMKAYLQSGKAVINGEGFIRRENLPKAEVTKNERVG